MIFTYSVVNCALVFRILNITDTDISSDCFATIPELGAKPSQLQSLTRIPASITAK